MNIIRDKMLFCPEILASSFKKAALTGSLLLFFFSLHAQKIWDGEAGTNNWGDAVNWSGNNLPVTGDDVLINTAVTVSGVPSITLNSLTIDNNVTLEGGSGITITINNTNANAALNVGAGRTLTLGGGTVATVVNFEFQAITTSPAIAGNLVINSQWNNNANHAITYNGNVTINTNGIFTTGTGAQSFNGNLIISGIWNSASSAVAVNLNGDLNVNTGSTFNSGAGTYTLTGTNQVIGGTASDITFANLTLSGGGMKSLSSNVSITNALNLLSGVLQLGNFNLIFSGTTGPSAITGVPDLNNMIETNGTGALQFSNAALANTALNGTYPVGLNGTYNPVVITGLTGGDASRSLSIRVVSGQLFVNGVNRYWELNHTNVTGTATLSFRYNTSEATGDISKFQPLTNISGAWSLAPNPSAQGVNPVTSTTTAALPSVSLWTAATPNTFYSYQTGNWNDPNTWTFDPSGSTLINPINAIPGNYDVVNILTSRTVSLSSDVASVSLDITINTGGFLDMSTYSFSSGLEALRGNGTLKLATVNFPSPIVTNNFVTAAGGTAEYYNSANFNLPAVQTTYNHLAINTGTAIATQTLNTLTLNGDLHIKSGTFCINDATAARRALVINGNVVVDNGGSITVGTGVTNTTTVPTGINGGTAPFINYYNSQSHRVEIYGNFTNNGIVRFTNLNYPVYNAFPPTVQGATTGFATVYFRGSSDKTLTCNNTTDFYNLVIDKGVDQTFSLTIYSSAYSNFRLFGANIAAGDVTAPATAANPNLKKALWIRTGTLDLKGLTVIPSLSEGTTTGPPSSDYFIPANAALVLDGPDVVVLSTADDYREVNAAYNVSGGTGLVNGVGQGGNSALSVLGKLQINNGYLSTRESAGITYWNYASGQFIINGGTIDAKQFRDALTGNTGLISYVQNGGSFILRGRFQRNASPYSAVSDLINASQNTTRALNGVDATGTTGTFSLNTNTANGFNMAGGTIRINDVCGNTAATSYLAYQIGSSVSNINVTGGTVEIFPTNGTGNNPTNYLINTTAPVPNLLVNRTTSSSGVQLISNPLTVKKDLTLNFTAVFLANNLDVSIGGNFSIANGTTYTPGTNNTIFNGSGTQQFTVNLLGALSLYNLRIDKAPADALVFDGTQKTINITNMLSIVNGRLNDNGCTINVTGNIENNGTHFGTGKIVLIGTSVQTIGGNGNGVFNNIDLNNTNAAAAPVSITAGVTVTGALQLVSNKILNIADNNLKLTTAGTISAVSGFSNSCFIQTTGLAGDGGITKDYSSSVSSFAFPVGAPTITPAAAAAYTPVTVTVNGTPTSYGSITIVPVGIEHPNTTTKGRSLTYYWRVKSGSGFNLGTATASYSFTYATKDIVTGAGISENEYVPARYDQLSYSWTSGTSASINTGTHTMDGPWLNNTTHIDGEYTAGDNNPDNPFYGTPQKLYSRQSGLWSDVNTWSKTGHTINDPPASPPGASDIVIIGGNDSIILQNFTFVNRGVSPPAGYYQLNAAVVSCASLQIEKGSALDIQNNPGCNFGVVRTHPNGNGNFRLATSYTSGTFYTFPSGDFSDFNVNVGTTEFYTVNPEIGPYFILPTNASSYGTVILSPLGGSNLILPNLPTVTIYGDLICRGETWESWLAMSWNGTYGAIVPKTVYVKGDLNLQGGSFVYAFNGNTAQNIVIDGDVNVAPLAGLDIYNASNNTMSIGGSLINNSNNGGPDIYGGFAGSNVRFYKDANNKCDVTFFGSNSASITNNPAVSASPNTIFNRVTVNKGTSQAVTLTFDITGTLTTPSDNWLTMQNGTLRYIRTGNLNITTTSTFAIPATAGLWINTPSNVYIGNSNSSNNDLFLSGKLTLAAGNTGNVYVGPSTFPNNNNDIEYSSGGYSAIEVHGGNLYVNGQIRRNPSTANSILKYSQSAGTVTINGNAAITSNAKLEVLNNGSQFNMSGGTLTIVRGGGANYGDLYLRPQTSVVSGGTIIFSQGALASQNYLLESNVPLNHLIITGATGQPATVRLMISPLVVNGNLTLSNANSILNATNFGNSIDVTLNGNFINNGGVTSYVYGTNTTTFSASTAPPYLGAQILTGATNFYDLQVSPGASLTISNGVIVNHDLSINSGTLICGANKADVAGNFTNNGNYTDNNVPNTGISLNGTTSQQVGGSGSFGRLELNNPAGARLNSSISLQEDLVMSQGIFDVNLFLITLGVNSDIIIVGAPFSATKMITTQGVYSNIGIKKFFSTSPQVFTYPIGTTGKYTPAILTINSSSYVGSIRINNINNTQPAVIDPSNALKYYWEVESSGISGFSGNIVFNYLPGDVVGSQENNYLATRLIVPGTTWSLTSGVDPVAKTITFNYSNSLNLCGEYTAGIAGAFPPNVPTFTSIANGNWNDNTIWSQTGGTPFTLAPGNGPNGFIVVVNHEVTTNANYCSAYKTTINGKLKIVSPYFGHNLGTVTGNGTLYLEIGTFPAGVYTTFLDCDNNGTIEYGGTGSYSIVADLYDKVPNLLFSGTGARILPDKDLTICNSLKIGTVTDGPILDNSVYNRKLIIQGTIERYNTGLFNSGTGAGAAIEFAGSMPQVVGGATGNFNGSNAFNNLEINNAQGLTLNGSTDVSGHLLLTEGLINTSAANNLTIVNTEINCVIPPGGTATSFVNGPLTKRINQGDNFTYPVGINNITGNKISLSATQTGTLLWTAQYFRPNSTFNSFTTPLSAVSWNEYWKVTGNPGSNTIININWDPSSDITPLVTQGGLPDMRVAGYNTATSRWIEIPSTASGNDYYGTVSTTDRVTIPTLGSADYTSASVTTIVPKAKLAPSGPVCGTSGVPVIFSAPVAIPFNYALAYSVDGGLPQTVVVTPAMIPYSIPTNPVTSQTIQLTSFTYNTDEFGAGGIPGVIDATIVTAYASPTVADAGDPQSLCGLTSAILDGNTPMVGTGVWNVLPPNFGGTVITPTSPTSQFNGLNNKSYTLRWKISNGNCTSSSNVTISFTILPDPPSAAPNQVVCSGATISDLVAYTPIGSIYWFLTPTGGTALSGTTPVTDGTVYYAEADNGCKSETRTQVTVTINDPVPPTGASPQVFCSISNPTVADLVVTGTGIQWYATATGGTPLTGTTALVSGNTYYASQTVTGCESDTRLAVVVTINDPVAPTGINPQVFCSINNPTVAGLVATGTGIQWYATETGGTPLAGTTALINGNTYYASQTVSGCESDTRLAVVVTINDPVAPTGISPQVFCSISNPTVASLVATGIGIQWYATETGGTPLAGTTVLTDGTTYYASQTVSGCESDTRLAVLVTINDPVAPTGTSPQVFCSFNNPTVASLVATGIGIQWYTTATGGTPLAGTTALVSGNTYYAAQTISGCESNTRLAVQVTINDPAAPTGTSPQVFCSISNPTVASLVVTGTGIQWYATATGGTPLTGTTALVSGNTYYATQTVGGCESDTRLAVQVTINDPAAPTGTSPQVFCSNDNPTIASLIVTGVGIQWYATATGGTPLAGTTAVIDGSTYYASQTVNGCESDMRFAVSVEINTSPVTSAITGNTTPICEAGGITYSVSLTPGSSYSWTVPSDAVIISGNTGPNNNEITVDFGVMSGSVTVIETSADNCQGDPVQLTVDLQGCDLVADFFADDTEICMGEEVIFTDNSQGTTSFTVYEWDFGDGADPASSTSSGNQSVTYTTPGLKTVRLIITQGFSDTLLLTDYITVNKVPVATVESIERCGPGDIDFVASISDGDQVGFSTDGGISEIFTDDSEPYTYTVYLEESSFLEVFVRGYNTITGCYGAWDSSAIGRSYKLPVTEKIAAADPGTDVGYVDVVCANEQDALYYVNADPNATYNWQIPGLGITVEDQTQVEVDWNVAPGEYVIELQKISEDGCVGNVRDTLVKVALPEPDLGGDVAVCDAETYTFSLTEDYENYEWHDFSTNPTFTTSTEGQVSVRVWDKYGCEGSDTASLAFYTSPVVDLGNDTVICGDNPLQLDAGDFAFYDWSTGENTNPITVREGAGTISVTVTDEHGCQGSDEIIIRECDPETLLGIIPNIITPNNDNKHDSWEIRNIYLFPDASIQIFDRWGRLVFEANGGYDNDWYGTGPNGNDLPVDTYYYIIDLKVPGYDPITGSVSIIR